MAQPQVQVVPIDQLQSLLGHGQQQFPQDIMDQDMAMMGGADGVQPIIIVVNVSNSTASIKDPAMLQMAQAMGMDAMPAAVDVVDDESCGEDQGIPVNIGGVMVTVPSDLGLKTV